MEIENTIRARLIYRFSCADKRVKDLRNSRRDEDRDFDYENSKSQVVGVGWHPAYSGTWP
jgi:hypothetical protein